MTKKQLVDKVVVAERYGVCERTVRRWIALGMPAHRGPGGRPLRFSVEEVDAWTLQAGRPVPPAPTSEGTNAAHE